MFYVGLGCLSLLVMLLSNAYVFSVNWHFIISGQGVGVYSVVVHIFAFMISFAVWLFSFVMYRNKVLALFYWVTSLLPLPLFLLYPVWFQAPTIS